MKVIRDGSMLCDDCLIVAVNGDYTGFDYSYGPSRRAERDARIAAVSAGLERLGGHLVPAFDSETGEGVHEFRRGPCDCCRSPLAGQFHEFAILGED